MLVKPPKVEEKISPLPDITDKSLEIRKKTQFRELKKIVDEYGITSTIVLAEALGVHRTTVSEWLTAPEIKLLMAKRIKKHMDYIEEDKDWNARKYAIETLKRKIDKSPNLTQINNIIENDKAKYNI